MIRNTLFTLIVSISLVSTGKAQVPNKIIVEQFTNTNCSTCASRNPGFNSNMSSRPEILRLSVYPSSPYPNCLLHQQNAEANDARTNYYGIYGGTPRLVINGNVLPTSANYGSAAIFDPYQSQTSPASIWITQQKFSSDSIRVVVTLKTEETHSLAGLSMFVALAEDTVFYTGGNNEPQHYNVFRKSLTSATGFPITLPASVGDSVTYSFLSDANAVWNFSRIYAVVILQETATKTLVQAEALAPTAVDYVTGISDSNGAIDVRVFPNPAINLVTIQLPGILPSIVNLYTAEGKLVYRNSEVLGELKLDLSAFPKAVYLLQVENTQGRFSQKLIRQ